VDHGDGGSGQGRSKALPETFELIDEWVVEVPTLRAAPQLRHETLVRLVQPVLAGPPDAVQRR
jgi:hypothetical protein